MRRRGKGGGSEYAQDLIDRFGAQMLATARRYSSTDEDAEDAYQRATEIALVHRPSGERDDLLRWLRTTAKHEALAIRRHRSRVIAVGAPESVPEASHAADPHQRAERLEQLRHGAEALRRLKPQEVRALQLRAEGYSYKEICEITGWTYTKVNRCLAEGRQAFLRTLSQIESGAECDRLAPHLSALVDREATPADLEALRPHLATCLACRARLREYRAVPSRVAALVPIAAVATDPATVSSPLRSLYDTVAGATHDRWTALTAATQERVVAAGDRLHQATELAAAQKVAAVAASTVALTGGVVASDHRNAPEPSRAKVEQQVAPSPSSALPPIQPRLGSEDAPLGPASGDSDPAPRPADAEDTPPSAPVEFGPELSPPAQAGYPKVTEGQPAAVSPAPAAPAASHAGPGAFER
ncbi:MAG TPA: sigma-70 family RNA polymerase sigma factor [Thermoleophilaceae bacterium]|nr:sigma-70 family RNA polymerase sigma factor [Thermoleophilaceae bacterium]